MTKEEKELMDEKFKRVYATIEANAEVSNAQHNSQMDVLLAIKNQTEKTNGRVNTMEDKVTNLEDETKNLRWIAKNPGKSIFIAVLLVAGFVFIGTLIGWNNIMSLI